MVRVSTVFLQPSGQVQEDLKNIAPDWLLPLS